MGNIFRDRGERRYSRHFLKRKFVGTNPPVQVKLQATHVGAEVLTQQTPKVRGTHVGAEILTQQTPKVRASHVGAEVLLTYPLPAVTTTFVPHIFEDYV